MEFKKPSPILLSLLIGVLLGISAAVITSGINASSKGVPTAALSPVENTSAPEIITTQLSTPEARLGEGAESYLATNAAEARARRPAPGKEAPDFRLTGLDGAEYQLSDYRGSPVLLNFWATWCPPCRSEMPIIQAASDRFQDQSLTILTINSTYVDSQEEIRKFLEETEVTLPVLLDDTGSVTGGDYSLDSLPISIFIDQKGIIQWVQLGEINQEQLDRALERILPGTTASNPVQ